MITDGRGDEALDLMVELLSALRDKNSQLQLRLMKLLRERYGRKSEGISTEQLSLLLGELEAGGGDKVDEDALMPLELPPDGKKRKKRSHGRRKLPDVLEREVKEMLVEGEERICVKCGTEKQTIGWETSETLEFEPAHFMAILHKREKVACRSCGDGVVIAPHANKVIERGLPGPGMLAELLVNKYRDALPLYRQAQRYLRLGVKIPRSTLSDWNGAVCDLLRPIVAEIRRQVLDAYLLGADGTQLKVLDRKHEANIKRGGLWCYVGDGKNVYFDYVMNQSKEGPLSFLRERVGYVQADADPKLDELFKGEDATAIEVGCWMHGRRKFKEALDGGDLRAAYPVKIIKHLYKIEAYTKKVRAGPDEVKQLRQEKSVPLLNQLGRWIADNYQGERPSSPLGKAMGYALRQWEALIRYTEDGRLPIDNGEVERAIRVVAVGRKNYLFAGSDAGGERAAIAYSLLGSCTLASVDPWAYLKDVLEKIAGGWKQSRIDELLPDKWAGTHPHHLIDQPSTAAEDGSPKDR
jgi:transposase